MRNTEWRRKQKETVNTKAKNGAPSKQGGIALVKRKRLIGAEQSDHRRD